jgi:hypothetical protein
LVFKLAVEYQPLYLKLLFCCQLIVLNQFQEEFILFVEYLCLIHFVNQLESFYFVNLKFRLLKTFFIADYWLIFEKEYLILSLAIGVRLAINSINSNIAIIQDWN